MDTMHRLTIITTIFLLGFYPSPAQSWELIYEAPFGVGTNNIDEIFDLQRIGDSTIWISGGPKPFIAVSHDLGQSWMDMSNTIPNQVQSRIVDINFINQDFGLFGSGTGEQALFYTENGGQSWQPATIIHQNFEPITSFGLGDMVFKNSQEGWALKIVPPVTLLHTIDGGRNWEIQFQVHNERYRNIAYQNGDTLVITNNEHLMFSHDGGENWENIEDNLWQDRYSAFFLNRQHGWWAGDENQTHRTYDSGINWDTSYISNTTSSPEDYKIRRIFFANDSIGWATLRVSNPKAEGVYASTNGGADWAQQNPAIENPWRIIAYGDTLAYILTTDNADDRGKVYRYRKRKASCLQAGSISVADSNSLYPLLSWQQATGAYDGYYLQLGSTPGGQDILPRTDVGLDTFYQVSTPLPDGVELYASVLPYNHILGAAEGCGSLAFTTPACPPPMPVDTGYCKGGSLLWVDSLIIAPGAYTFADTLSSGCVQETQLQVQQYDNPSTSIDTAYCAGAPFYWQDSLLSGPGTYQFGYTSAQGCDSTVLLRVEEWPAPMLRIDTFICEGGSYTGQDTLISDAGTYSFHYNTALGCDSTVQLFLEELPNAYTEIDTSLTAGELYDGQAYEGDTTLIYNLTAANGCDSIVTVYIDVVTSTYQPQQVQALRVLPNPSSGDFTILALPNATTPVRLQVLDSSGKRILDQEADLSSDYILPAQGWPAGLYLLRAEVNGELYTARLIKSR
jgi:photosystem II stability/assembly factor-like uncharacterized protein